MKAELYHDILAKKVYEKASAEEKMRLKVERFIRERYEFLKGKDAWLSKKDLEYILPFLKTIDIRKEEQQFIEESQKALRKRARRQRQVTITVIVILSVLLGISIWLGFQASESANRAAISAQEADTQKKLTQSVFGQFVENQIAYIKSLQEADRLEEAGSEALQFTSLLKETGDFSTTVEILDTSAINLADLLQKLGASYHFQEQEKAITYYKGALDWWENINGASFQNRDDKLREEVVRGQLIGNLYLSDCYSNMENEKMAENILLRTLGDTSRYRSSLNPDDYNALLGQSFYRTGAIYYRSSNFDEALTFLNFALDYYKGDIASRANVIYMMGGIYFKLENWDKAIGCFQKVYSDEEKSSGSISRYPLSALALSYLGWSYFQKKDYEKALKYLLLAKELFQKNSGSPTNFRRLSLVFSRIAAVYLEIDDYEQARKCISRSISFLVAPYSSSYKSVLADDYQLLGELFLRQKDYHQALANFNLSLEYAIGETDKHDDLSKLPDKNQEIAHKVIFIETLGKKAKTLHLLGQDSLAIAHYDFIVQFLREFSQNDENKAEIRELIASCRPIFEAAIEVSLQSQEYGVAKAFEYAQAENHFRIMNSNRPVSILNGASLADSTGRQDEEPQYYPLQISPSLFFTPQYIQENILRNDEALVFYFTGEDKSYVFFLSQTGVECHESTVPTENIKEWVITVRYELHSSNNVLSQPFLKASHSLYRALIKPIEANLHPNQELLIIADGILSGLPFEVLLSDLPDVSKGDNTSYSFLGKEWTFNYTSSLPIFKEMRKPIELPFWPRLLIACPSENKIAKNEASMLCRSYGWRCEEYIPDGKGTLISQLGNDRYPLVHILGTINTQSYNPGKFYLELSAMGNNNNIVGEQLFLSDLYSLRLNKQLVVLGGNNIGRFEGDVMTAFTNAFAFAGARSIVFPICVSNDRSQQELMRRFYKNWNRNKSTAEALHDAKASMMEDKEWSHPGHWAGFIAIDGL